MQDCIPTSCSDNGDCYERVGGGAVCLCDVGWGGDSCNEDIVDNCLNNSCENGGNCTDGLNNYTCSCLPQWTGHNCETSQWYKQFVHAFHFQFSISM